MKNATDTQATAAADANRQAALIDFFAGQASTTAALAPLDRDVQRERTVSTMRRDAQTLFNEIGLPRGLCE